jgi:cytochrome P450
MQPLFNPASAEFIRDPYPFYRRLRATDPYYRSPFGFVALTRDCDVRAVLADRRFGRDFLGQTTQSSLHPLAREPAIASMRHWMLMQDPPDHTRLRGLVVKAFTARRVQDMRPRIQAIVDSALDHMAQKTSVDLMADFALRVPATTICELLGIPKEDRATFLTNSTSFSRLLDPVPLNRSELAHANGQHEALSRYFALLFERRRHRPTDDLLSQLVLLEEQGDRLSTEELTANVIFLFAAGYDTTTNLIGNGLLALFRHPDQLAMLRADPSLIGNAVEEFLRYDSSVQFSSRAALEEVTLGDCVIAKGGAVICAMGSANRDEAVYDQPDQLDITRRNIKVLSFGGGIHHCIGAQLARLEAEIAIAGIVRRFPDLRADDSTEPVWRPSISLRGLLNLPARL